MSLTEALAILTVVVVVPMHIAVTWILRGLSGENPRNKAFRDRTVVQGVLTVMVAIFALIFLNNDMPVPFISTNETKLITRAVVLASVISAAYFLWLWFWNGRGRGPDHGDPDV